MKKAMLSFISITALFFAFMFCVHAEGTTGKIEVLNSSGSVVKTFSIVTDDPETNSRTAIQKALNYIKENAGEKNIHTLKLPKGNYGIFSSLDVYGNTVIDLSGSVLYRKGDCASVIRFGKGSDVTYGYNGYRNVTIKNGTIDSQNTGKYSLMLFAHAYNVTLSNLTFQNTQDVQHLLTFAACSKVRVKNCNFYNMKISEKKEKYNCEAIQIDILKEGHFKYPAMDGTRTKDVIVENCNFSNVPRGVGTHSAYAGHYFDDIKIINNTFKNIEGYAISALNYRNSEISGNTISDCGSGITCNTVTSSTLGHFYAPVSEDYEITPDVNVKIFNNTITIKNKGYNHTAYGINLFGMKVKNKTDSDGKKLSGDFRISGVTVENNTITSYVTESNTYGIRIEGAFGSAYGKDSNLKIQNNKIIFKSSKKTTCINYGMKLASCSKIYIYGNTVYDKSKTDMNLQSGIVAESSSYLSVRSNKISNTSSFGLKLTTLSSAMVSGNTMKNNKSNAIYVYSGSKKVTVSSNKIYSCGAYAVAARDSSLISIKSNQIYSPASVGIYLTGSASCTEVSSNYICDSLGRGIVLNKTASAKSISKNQIDLTSSKLDAISISDSASAEKISYNKINCKENKKSNDLKVKCKNGIIINSKSCKISEIKNNQVKRCAENGIYIKSAKSKAKITNNYIYSCKNGILYSKGTLSKNNVKKYSASKYKKA